MKLKIINGKNTGGLLAVLSFLMVTTGVRAQQQSFSYTQYMDNLTPLNPAYSLLDKAGSISSLARREWAGIEGAPTTFLFNGNLPIPSINASTGLIVLNDQFAIEHQTEVNAYFAKAIQLGPEHFLAVSINAGVRSYTANFSTLGTVDPVFANNINETRPNVGFGVLYYSSWYYLGVSIPELTINSLGTASIQDNTNFRNHYYFSGALITTLNDDFKFKPATLFSYAKGVPLIADISGTLYIKDIVGIGLNYRTNKEMAGMLTLNLDAFRIGYSYQFGTAPENLGGLNNATHEVTLSYRFGKGAANPKLL